MVGFSPFPSEEKKDLRIAVITIYHWADYCNRYHLKEVSQTTLSP